MDWDTPNVSLFICSVAFFFHSVGGKKNCFGNVQTVHVMLLKKKKGKSKWTTAKFSSSEPFGLV